MDVPPLEQSETETYPLLMERSENLNNSEHIVNISDTVDTSSSSLAHGRLYTGSNASQIEDRSASITRVPISQPSVSSNGSNSRNSSFIRRGDTRRRRSPLNSRLWISIELVITLSQIVAAVVVLSLSRQEHPHAPLFEWIVGYASGCVATLPLLYWRYSHHNQTSEPNSSQSRPSSSQISLSASRTSEGDDRQTTVSPPRSNQGSGVLSLRLKILVEYFKMGLDCYFAIWFVVGNVWIFGGHSSASESPNLYRLCIVFLTFSCIGYAMPFVLCVTICCCLPCIISILGLREDLSQTRGATAESINSLPTYKFKMKRSRSVDESNLGVIEGGVVAAGTDKERMISGEDAVCCICLAKYANNDELRELPCSHFFHKDCVDKWLKINALCPLCKMGAGESILGPNPVDGSSANPQREGESSVGTTLTLF